MTEGPLPSNERRSADVAALDARHLWHPYTQHWQAPAPVEIVRASGATLHTADGRPILDAISSWWVTLHGHAEPTIAEAIAEQARTLEQVIFAGCTHEPAVRLAAALARVAPAGHTVSTPSRCWGSRPPTRASRSTRAT